MTIQIPEQSGSDPKARPASPAFRWFPIRSLGPRQRPRVLAHLLSLNEPDRYLRFGYAANDAHIGRYVDQLDFDRDELFGIFNRRLELVAMAHLALLGNDGTTRAAEFGVSVLPQGRGRGLASRLFEIACLHARNRGIDTLMVHALSENAAMLHIARQAGATVDRAGPDATATLRLPADDLSSQLTQMVETRAAEFDYGLKKQAAQFQRLFRALCDPQPGDGNNVQK